MEKKTIPAFLDYEKLSKWHEKGGVDFSSAKKYTHKNSKAFLFSKNLLVFWLSRSFLLNREFLKLDSSFWTKC